MRRWIGIGLLAALGCGRSSFPGGGLPEIAESDSGSDSAPEGEPEPPVDPPDPPPEPPPPVDVDGCGDGVVTPGQMCFESQRTFASRIDPCSIDVGDLDDDGHLDVAVPNSDFEHAESQENYASVLYGDGAGGLSAALATDAGGDVPVGLVITDLELDGRDDLVVANNESSEVTAMVGLAWREFGAPVPTFVGQQPLVVTAADLDGDGFEEVAVTISGAPWVAILRNAGAFLLPPEFVEVAGSPWALTFADLDGNGSLDLLATDSASDQLSIRFGRGDGTFVPSDARLTVGFGATDVVVADLDGNGTPDIVTANHDENTVSVLRGQGGGIFVADPDLPTDAGPRALAVADFDADGRLDLAVAHDVAEVVTFHREDPTTGPGGPLEPSGVSIRVGTLPSGIRAGDFNEDGIADVAVSNQLDNEVGLVLSDP